MRGMLALRYGVIPTNVTPIRIVPLEILFGNVNLIGSSFDGDPSSQPILDIQVIQGNLPLSSKSR